MPSATTLTWVAVLRTETARPANAAGTLYRLRSSTTRQVLETRSICATYPSKVAVIFRKAICSSAKQSAIDRSGVAGCLRWASSRHRMASHSFNASKSANRNSGVNNHSRMLPTWFST